MGRPLVRMSILAALVVVAVGCGSVHGGEPAADPPAPAAGAAPVVLELFTSQGCSSCPPADRVLSALGSDASIHGRVVPLAFHVDYWNSIGWADPFSSADWSARQTDYARRFALDSVYTPQIVVNGRAQLNGSDEAGIRREIAAAARDAAAATVTLSTTNTSSTTWIVDVSAQTPAAVDAAKLDAVVVLFETGLVTQVRRGENSGRELHDDFVVRRLERAFSFEPAAGASHRGRVTFDLDGSWSADRLGVAAFLQDPNTLRIYGAAVR